MVRFARISVSPHCDNREFAGYGIAGFAARPMLTTGHPVKKDDDPIQGAKAVWRKSRTVFRRDQDRPGSRACEDALILASNGVEDVCD
jgi:hypothetical protein